MKGNLKKISVLLLLLLCVPIFTNEYFTGDGRSDMNIQVENPSYTNIGDEVSWLTDFVVNTITDDIKKYSGIQVSDIYNASRVIKAQKNDENASYSEDDGIEAGNFTVAKQIMFVSIVGKGTSYAVSVRVNDKEKNTSLATYNNPNCSYIDLDSGKILKEAVADILNQLGVKLTQAGKTSLLSVHAASNDKTIEAQKLVAKGNVAASQGSNIQALTYYIEARTADSGLERAIKSMSETAKTIAAGDYGAKARNLIQRRNDFIALLNKVKEYFKKNPPYYIVISPELKMGKVYYEKNSFDIEFPLYYTKDFEKIEIYKSIVLAYIKEEDYQNWNLDLNILPSPKCEITIQALENGKVIGTDKASLDIRERFRRDQLKYYRIAGIFAIAVPADADVSQIKLNVSSVIDEKGNVKNIPCLFLKDYVTNVLKCDYNGNLLDSIPLEYVEIPETKQFLFVKNTEKLNNFMKFCFNITGQVYNYCYEQNNDTRFEADIPNYFGKLEESFGELLEELPNVHRFHEGKKKIWICDDGPEVDAFFALKKYYDAKDVIKTESTDTSYDEDENPNEPWNFLGLPGQIPSADFFMEQCEAEGKDVLGMYIKKPTDYKPSK